MNNFKLARKILCTVLVLGALFHSIGATSFAQSVYDDLVSNGSYKLGGSYNKLCDELSTFRSNYRLIRRNMEDDDFEDQKCVVYSLIPRKLMIDFTWHLPRSEMYSDEYKEFLLYEMPAIIMTKQDAEIFNIQWKSLTIGINERRQYFEKQYEKLVNYGTFTELLENALNSIEQNFPDKYREAICEVREYIELLNFRIEDGVVKVNDPKNPNEVFIYKPLAKTKN